MRQNDLFSFERKKVPSAALILLTVHAEHLLLQVMRDHVSPGVWNDVQTDFCPPDFLPCRRTQKIRAARICHRQIAPRAGRIRHRRIARAHTRSGQTFDFGDDAVGNGSGIAFEGFEFRSFEHDAALGLRSGIPHDDTPVLAIPFADLRDEGRGARKFLDGNFARHGNIDEHLGKARHDAGKLGERGPAATQNREDTEGGKEAVARGGVIEQDDMAALFAAQGIPAGAHGLDDITVAHARLHGLYAAPMEGLVKPKIAHDGRDQGVFSQQPSRLVIHGEHGHGGVAVDDAAEFVDEDEAIGVAVEGDADVGAVFANEGRAVAGMEGSDAVVDVVAVGLTAGGNDLGTEFLKNGRGDAIGRTVGAVDDDTETLEIELALKIRLDERIVTPLGVIDAARPADMFGRKQGIEFVGMGQKVLYP